MAPSLLASLLPSSVACCEKQGLSTGALLPEEAALLDHGWSAGRRREFTAGRQAARGALAALTGGRHPILRGETGVPVWPGGICGSITHCSDYCAAAVASTADLLTIGIDAEPHASLPAGVLPLIATAEELGWLSRQDHGKGHWDRLLFSIKESVYKAWYPVARCWLDFQEASIRIDTESARFEVNLRHCRADLFAGGQMLQGRYLLTPALILSTVFVPQPESIARGAGPRPG